MLDEMYCNLMLVEGLDKVSAYKQAFPNLCENKTDDEILELATKRLHRKDNELYITEKSKEIEKQESDKYKWTLERANKELIDLVEELKKRVYDGSSKMAEIVNINNAIKELNLINGHQQHKVDININPIQSVNINKLKTYDEDGNIIDSDFKEKV